MVFTYILLPEAQVEYDDSVMWYIGRSIDAANNFVDHIDKTLEALCHNPKRGKKIYHDFYEIMMEKFPFSIISY